MVAPQHRSNSGKEVIRRISYETTEFAKTRAISSAEYYKSLLTQQIESLSKALKITSNNLQSQDQLMFSQLSHQASLNLDKMCGRVQKKRIPELIDDVDQFAKQRPVLFVCGSFGIGFLFTRLLKWAYEEEQLRAREIDHPEIPSGSHETH